METDVVTEIFNFLINDSSSEDVKANPDLSDGNDESVYTVNESRDGNMEDADIQEGNRAY